MKNIIEFLCCYNVFKKRGIFLFFFILCLHYSGIVYAQEEVKDCNRSVLFQSYLKHLPKEVCLPHGNYIVFQIFEETDINGDSLDDFIFSWCRKPFQDGDTTFVSVYFQSSDSSYVFCKTFDNLYPLYLKGYNETYRPKEEYLRILQKEYMYEYLLLDLKFEGDKILVSLKNDAESNLIVTYQFCDTKNNWIFLSSKEYYFSFNGYSSIDLSKVLGPTIDQFKYVYP